MGGQYGRKQLRHNRPVEVCAESGRRLDFDRIPPRMKCGGCNQMIKIRRRDKNGKVYGVVRWHAKRRARSLKRAA